jgi:predicted ester cyclase
MTASRIDQVTRALRSAVTGEVVDLAEIFTEDVIAWSPNLFATSLSDLSKAFGEREDAFSDIVLDVNAQEVPGQKVVAEWSVAAVHSGPVTLDVDVTIEPTGRRVVLAGATIAEFRGDRISAMRSYFDDAALLEQMLAPA